MDTDELLEAQGPASWRLELDVRSDLCLSGSSSSIAAAQVRGLVRDACVQLAALGGLNPCFTAQRPNLCGEAEDDNEFCAICRIFGAPGGRGKVRFTEFRSIRPLAESCLVGRRRQPVARRCRAGEAGGVEYPNVIPPGTQFEGRIDLIGGILPAEATLLRRAIHMVDCLGGGRSAGFGRIAIRVREGGR